MLIWGTRTRAAVLALTWFLCGYCHHEAPQRVYERVTKFTFFFIPLFATSRLFSVECVACGAISPIGKDYADEVVEWYEEQKRRAGIVQAYEALRPGR